MPLTGRIFDISKGCVDDGPGLRTVIFFKGCHLDCPWCHNIEGKSFGPEIALNSSYCIVCKKCLGVCPRKWKFNVPNSWRSGCTACGLCAAVCPSHARRFVGKEYTVDQLLSEVIDDINFFIGTSGGITFSGGEPLAQSEFLFACAQVLKTRGVHLAIETAGYWSSNLIEELIRQIDLIIYDLKHVDSEKFHKIIGKENKIILNNLKQLLTSNIEIEIRIPVIPGFNDTPDDLISISKWLNTCSRIPPVKLLPFHRLAIAKQHIFGRSYPYAEVEPLSEKKLVEAKKILINEGISIENK